jgi:hypothetical protein
MRLMDIPEIGIEAVDQVAYRPHPSVSTARCRVGREPALRQTPWPGMGTDPGADVRADGPAGVVPSPGARPAGRPGPGQARPQARTWGERASGDEAPPDWLEIGPQPPARAWGSASSGATVCAPSRGGWAVRLPAGHPAPDRGVKAADIVGVERGQAPQTVAGPFWAGLVIQRMARVPLSTARRHPAHRCGADPRLGEADRGRPVEGPPTGRRAHRARALGQQGAASLGGRRARGAQTGVVAGPRPLGRTLTARTDEQALIAAEDKGGGSRPPQGLSRPDPPVQAWPFPGRHRSQPCSPNGHAGAAELLRPLARLRQWQDQIQGPQRGRRTRGTPPANLVGSRKDRVGQPVQPTTPLFFCPLRCYAPRSPRRGQHHQRAYRPPAAQRCQPPGRLSRGHRRLRNYLKSHESV